MTETTAQISVMLKEVDLFRELPLEALDELADNMNYRRVQAGETLVHSLDDSSDVYYVLEGRLRATLCSAQGRQTIFRDFGTGEFLGEFAAIDGQMRSATISALTPGFVACQTSAEFHAMLENHHSVMKATLRHLTSQIRVLVRRVYELSSHSVQDRLYAELLRLGGYGDGADELIIAHLPTHEEIAGMVGTHREAITRELSKLVRNGVITKSGKRVTIIDPDYLMRNLDSDGK